MKKGMLDTDWVISLGIFLVFLAFFFIFLKPYAGSQGEVTDSLLFVLESNLRHNATWHIEQVPIIVRSNVTGVEPVIASFRLPWVNISFSDNASYLRSHHKIAFAPVLRPGSQAYWIVSSQEIYPQPVNVTDLAPTGTSVSISTSKFSARFDGIVTSASHFSTERLDTFNLSLNDVLLDTANSTSDSAFNTFAASYTRSYPQLNHTTFVVGGYPRLYAYATLKQFNEPTNLTIRALLYNYTSYHIDGGPSGALPGSTCASAASRFMDFSDDLSGVSFITEETANHSFCISGGQLRVSIELPLANESAYKIFFHEGNYNNTIRYITPYTTRLGMVENLSGLAFTLLSAINKSDYDSLKASWDFPSSRDFSFQLLNDSNAALFNYTPVIPGAVNIYAREFDQNLLDKYGGKKKYKIRLRAW
jgi:hypothetical protein